LNQLVENRLREVGDDVVELPQHAEIAARVACDVDVVEIRLAVVDGSESERRRMRVHKAVASGLRTVRTSEFQEMDKCPARDGI